MNAEEMQDLADKIIALLEEDKLLFGKAEDYTATEIWTCTIPRTNFLLKVTMSKCSDATTLSLYSDPCEKNKDTIPCVADVRLRKAILDRFDRMANSRNVRKINECLTALAKL